MDTKALRQKILDLAIHGKLVPQDSDDEPASVLLERIRAEKERLIKEGKIKKPKKTKAACDKPHYGNAPFEIPCSWEWCKLGAINEIARGGSPRPIKDYLTNDPVGINWIKIGDTTKDGKYIDAVKEKIRPEGVKKSRMVHKGDFLLTNSMSFGRPYILNVDGCIHDGWLVISPIGKAYTPDFLYYLLSSSFAFGQFTKVASGGVVTNLNSDKVAETIFPLPPYSEQKRIVAEIERGFALIDVLEYGKVELKESIKQTKSRILDLAIHGKLVPQDPNDEPASELLKRINPKAEITCDNPHYQNLPNGWAICKLEDIAEYEQPTAYIVNSTDYEDSYKIPVLTAGKSFIIGHTNEENGIYTNLPCIIFDDFTTDSKLVDFPFKVKSSAMKILQIKRGICIEYVAIFMSITRLISDTHKRYWISEYSKIPIPVPPKEEQIRIVDSVRYLFAKLKDIADCL